MRISRPKLIPTTFLLVAKERNTVAKTGKNEVRLVEVDKMCVPVVRLGRMDSDVLDSIRTSIRNN